MLCTWGRGRYGRLGHGDETDREAPTPVAALAAETIVAIAMGNCHAAAVSSDGGVWTWGPGCFGELGCGGCSEASTSIPRSIQLGVRAVAVSCGFYHSAAVSSDGGVWTWGWGRDGQLGHREPSGAPARVAALADVSVESVACGHASTVALSREGEVFAWGLLGMGGVEPSELLLHGAGREKEAMQAGAASEAVQAGAASAGVREVRRSRRRRRAPFCRSWLLPPARYG